MLCLFLFISFAGKAIDNLEVTKLVNNFVNQPCVNCGLAKPKQKKRIEKKVKALLKESDVGPCENCEMVSSKPRKRKMRNFKSEKNNYSVFDSCTKQKNRIIICPEGSYQFFTSDVGNKVHDLVERKSKKRENAGFRIIKSEPLKSTALPQ
jgi:hypothetical protein